MKSLSEYSIDQADIILITGSPQDGLSLTRMLSEGGYKLRQADSIDSAFAAIKRKKPDLIMLDDKVAGTDDFEIYQRLNKAPETRAIPIIILVSTEESVRKIAEIQSGRVDYIAKPFQLNDVLIRIKNNLAMYALYKKLAQRNQSLFKEIEDYEEKEQLFELEKERMQIILQAIGDGVIYANNAAAVTLMNETAKSFTGWLMEEAIGEPIEKVFKLVSDTTVEKYDDLVKKVLKSSEPYEVKDGVLLVSKDGNETLIEVSAIPVFQKNGMIDGVAVIFRNYAKERKTLKKVDFLNHYDQINGRYSRRNSDNELRRLGEDRYLPFSFVIADVNGLGLNNNVFGNKYSELLLKKLTNILKAECRPDDIVVRIGEAKFVVFMPSGDAKYADILIARLNKAVEKQSIRNVVFTLSVDYSLNSNIYDSVHPVLKKAEDEMCEHIKTDSLSIKSRIVFIVMNSLFNIDNIEQLHSLMVSRHSAAIAQAMGFGEQEIWQIKLAALLHDIGKIGINEIVLDLKGKLTAKDWEAIRKHPETGYKILRSSYEFSDIADFVLEHHERWDGKGYPRGLRTKEISLQARIITVADTYDDIVSERSYKKKLHKEDAINELKRCAGTQFDPDVVRVFIEEVLDAPV